MTIYNQVCPPNEKSPTRTLNFPAQKYHSPQKENNVIAELFSDEEDVVKTNNNDNNQTVPTIKFK